MGVLCIDNQTPHAFSHAFSAQNQIHSPPPGRHNEKGLACSALEERNDREAHFVVHLFGALGFAGCAGWLLEGAAVGCTGTISIDCVSDCIGVFVEGVPPR